MEPLVNNQDRQAMLKGNLLVLLYKPICLLYRLSYYENLSLDQGKVRLLSVSYDVVFLLKIYQNQKIVDLG